MEISWYLIYWIKLSDFSVYWYKLFCRNILRIFYKWWFSDQPYLRWHGFSIIITQIEKKICDSLRNTVTPQKGKRTIHCNVFISTLSKLFFQPSSAMIDSYLIPTNINIDVTEEKFWNNLDRVGKHPCKQFHKIQNLCGLYLYILIFWYNYIEQIFPKIFVFA